MFSSSYESMFFLSSCLTELRYMADTDLPELVDGTPDVPASISLLPPARFAPSSEQRNNLVLIKTFVYCHTLALFFIRCKISVRSIYDLLPVLFTIVILMEFYLEWQDNKPKNHKIIQYFFIPTLLHKDFFKEYDFFSLKNGIDS